MLSQQFTGTWSSGQVKWLSATCSPGYTVVVRDGTLCIVKEGC